MKNDAPRTRSFWFAVFLAVGLLRIPATAEDEVLPKRLVKYKELIQYVRDKKAQGQTESQVLSDSVKAGWPEPVAIDVILYVGTKDSAASDADRAYEYQIGAGDILHISVWDEPTLSSPSIVVRPDGMISMPLLKEIQVVGLTPTEAAKVIAQGLIKLKKEIAETDVTVVVTGIQSKKIYAIGAVKREGPIPYTYRMTVMQAISEAGGLTDYAKKKKIYVLRHENGRDRKLPFDYDEALNGENMDLNVELLPGDSLVVPH